MTNVTFCVPVKFDSTERRENLKIVKKYLKGFGGKIDIYETTETPFHRTKYINILLKRASTDIVCICDADVIVSRDQILEAVKKCGEGYTLAYPHSGKFLNIPQTLKYRPIKEWKNLEGTLENLSANSDSRGGMIFANRVLYKQCGLENEKFISWGSEDHERYSRVLKLEHKIYTVKGTLYHLNHPRGNDSWFTNPLFGSNELERHKIENMTKEELETYIKTWRWLE